MRFTKIKQHPIWTVFGLLLGAFFAAFIYRFIGTFVFGIFFYYVSRPVYRRLQTYIPYRGITAGISLIVVTFPLFVLLSWISIAALREYRILDEQLNVAAQLEPFLGPFIDLSAATDGNLSSITGSLDTLETILDVLLQYVSIFGIGATHLILMIVIAFYLLRDDHRLGNWIRSFDNDSDYLSRYMTAIDKDLHHIFFGNILNALFAGVISSLLYIGLNSIAPPTLSIPYPVLVGSIVGVASLIPIVGMKVAYFPIAAYLYAVTFLPSSEPLYWFPTTFLITSFIFVDGIPDLLLRPYVSGKNTHIGMLMGAYILGPFMFGWYGIFLAPMLLVFVVQYSRIILPELLENKELKPDASPTKQLILTDPGENTDTETDPSGDARNNPTDTVNESTQNSDVDPSSTTPP